MDSTIDTTKERLNVLETPPTSHVSFVVNGALNGASILGGISSLRDWQLKRAGKIADFNFSKTTIFATIAGTAIGAWFGAREAHNLTTYQTAVSEEIRKLRADLDAQAQNRAHQAR